MGSTVSSLRLGPCLPYPAGKDPDTKFSKILPQISGRKPAISLLRYPGDHIGPTTALPRDIRTSISDLKKKFKFPYIYQFAYGPTTDRNESRVLSGELFKYLYFQRLEILCWGGRELGELREIASPRRR